ncbi:MAG TPA: GDSL-type esterase/lipase family protein [Phycisphaerae bacterium]
MRYTSVLLGIVGWICAGMAGCNAGTGGGAPATPVNDTVAPSASPAITNTPSSRTASTTAAPTNLDAVPAVQTSVPKGDLPPLTLHLAGDSTVSNYAETDPKKQRGWGQELSQFFIDKVTIDNKAVGGASVATFKTGNWTKLIPAVKAGDYVMIQFGANDSGTVAGRHVEPAAFAAMYGTMADEVKAKGGTTIFVTPSAFFQWKGTMEDNSRLAPYAAVIVKEGADKGVLVDDLNARGVEMLNSIGQEEAFKLYLPSGTTVDKAHFLKPGSTKMAQLVAEELKRIHSPLAEYLK